MELYGGDILNTANATSLRVWNRFFLAVKDAREGRNAPLLEFPGTQGQRLHWQADSLLGYRVWNSESLTSWSQLETTETLDGDIMLPSPPGATSRFYRMEILEPAE